MKKEPDFQKIVFEFIDQYKSQIKQFHEKWLNENTNDKPDKIKAMQLATSFLDRDIPFQGPSHSIDKRYIKIDSQTHYLNGINQIVTKALEEQYLTIDFIEDFLNKNTTNNKRLFGNMFEHYILEKFCSFEYKTNLNLEILPNLNMDHLNCYKNSFFYSGKERNILNFKNIVRFEENRNYFLTTYQTNFPIIDSILLSQTFGLISIKTFSLVKKKNNIISNEDYAFEQEVMKKLDFGNNKTINKLKSFAETLKKSHGKCLNKKF